MTGSRPSHAASPLGPAEVELLLATAALAAGTAAPGRFQNALAAPLDWAPAIDAALRHGILGQLALALHGTPAARLPDGLHAAASRLLARRRAADADALTTLFRLLDALAAAGIQAVPFKGPLLARAAYGDLARRDFRDLDVLIDPAGIGKAIAALGALGYESVAADLGPVQRAAYWRGNGQDILFATDGLPIEPHWAFAPRSLGMRFPVGPVMARAVPVAVGGRLVRTLDTGDALIVAGLHGAKEEWARLLWIADVAVLLRRHPELDWPVTLDRARAAGAERMVLLGVALAARLLGATVPPEPQRRLAADPACGALAAAVAARLFDRRWTPGSALELSRFGWAVREHPGARWRYLFATLLAPRLRHYRMVALPEALGFLYPGVKVAHDYGALPAWLAVKALRPAAWRRA